MHQVLLIYALMFMMILALVLLAMRNDGALSQRLARVRVRFDENQRRGLSKSPKEDFEPGRKMVLLVLGIILLLVCMLLIEV